jgi:hypothetical protein
MVSVSVPLDGLAPIATSPRALVAVETMESVLVSTPVLVILATLVPTAKPLSAALDAMAMVLALAPTLALVTLAGLAPAVSPQFALEDVTTEATAPAPVSALVPLGGVALIAQTLSALVDATMEVCAPLPTLVPAALDGLEQTAMSLSAPTLVTMVTAPPPNTCTCDAGWEGTTCEDAICSNETTVAPTETAFGLESAHGILVGLDPLATLPSASAVSTGTVTAPMSAPVTLAELAQIAQTLSVPTTATATEPVFHLATVIVMLDGLALLAPLLSVTPTAATKALAQTPTPALVIPDSLDLIVLRSNALPAVSTETVTSVMVLVTAGPEWAGSSCTTPVCSAGCGNGDCVAPNSCSCDSGWTGTTCSTPICTRSNSQIKAVKFIQSQYQLLFVEELLVANARKCHGKYS